MNCEPEKQNADFGKGVSDAALRAVAQNALRHLSEADDHYKKQRWPSALISSVMSIEETGKLFSLIFNIYDERQPHRTKQILFGVLLHTVYTLGRFQHWASVARDGFSSDAILSEIQQQDVGKYSEFEELLTALRAGKLSDKTERSTAFIKAFQLIQRREHAETVQGVESLIQGRLHHLRMQATYVDVKGGKVSGGPAEINADTVQLPYFGALGYLLFAYLCLSAIRSPDWGMEDLNKLPDDLTGLESLSKFSLFGALVGAQKH